MSRRERRTLYDTWHLAASESIREEQVEEYQKVRFRHTRARQHFEEMKEQVDFLFVFVENSNHLSSL